MKDMNGEHLPQNCNVNLDDLDDDVLYHFNMSTKTHNFRLLFGDVKFVCCGGSASRMKKFTVHLSKVLQTNFERDCKGEEPMNFCGNSDRYVIHKVGPVLCANHGIGMASVSIMLHEMFKLLNYAGCIDVTFFRIGTCGGLGVEPGTVVISNGAFNAGLEPYFESYACGKKYRYSLHLDETVIADLVQTAKKCNIPATVGKTLSCDDFYEAQGRLDGAFCCFDEKEKMDFLNKAHSLNVRNIEMEATGFSAMIHRAGHKCAVACVALVNRLLGDQVKTPFETLKSWEEGPCQLVAAYIKESLYLIHQSKTI